jgi:photosystem II stability/assembly factor-like uncharacterized protein
MVTEKDGWAQSSSSLWRTTDGGRSWREVLVLGGGPVANVVAVRGTNWAAVLSTVAPRYTRLAIEQTSDGGTMWGRLPVTSTYQGSAALEPEQLDAVSTTELFALVRTGEGMNSPSGELLEQLLLGTGDRQRAPDLHRVDLYEGQRGRLAGS